MRPLLLIVDDNEHSALLLGRLLRHDGYDTEIAGDGAVALDRLARPPMLAALITDFHLPGIDGVVLGRHARLGDADLPIFVVTGDPAAVVRASLPASMELVPKPIDYAAFVLRLHAAIAHSRSPMVAEQAAHIVRDVGPSASTPLVSKRDV